LAEFAKEFPRVRPIITMGLALPKGVFVELDPFLRDAAENHGTKPTISDWQCLVPIFCGVVIP